MKIQFKRLGAAVMVLSFLGACASSVTVAVDPGSIKNRAKFDEDYKLCQEVAKTYDLSSDTGSNAVLGATAGAVGVAGIATAVAGAVFWPAIPFIIAGGIAGGGLGGGLTKQKENEARENILSRCLTERGYKAFGTARL